MAEAPKQLSLGVSLREDTTFDNYWVMASNQLVVSALRRFARAEGDAILTLWGDAGCGATHLLQACCHEASTYRLAAQYLPLDQTLHYEPAAVLEGLEALEVVCLDGVDALVGQAAWEQQLFHLYNRMKDAGRYLLMAFARSPAALNWHLPDLKSRVLGAVVYHVTPLDDVALSQSLQARAAARGMHLAPEVADYLLTRGARDTHSVFAVLDQLDAASLEQQRRLTIPFVKRVLGW